MRTLTTGVLATLALSLLPGCFLFGSEHEASPPQPLKNVIFRLGSQQDAVELRLEADWYASHNWEVVALPEGKVGPDVVTVVVRGVREPTTPSGSAAPAAARLTLPRDPDAKPGAWPLTFVLRQPGSPETKDAYTVEPVTGGWKVKPEAGSFSRYSAQGSY